MAHVPSEEPYLHRISVVIPVYRGEHTLTAVVDELLALATVFTTPGGRRAVVDEITLTHDHGPDHSDRVIRELAARHPIVKPVWLSRNFGQHAATLAGIASSGGEWVVTMDEDGQQDPADIAGMLDAALDQQAQIIYAAPTNRPPHGFVRNTSSRSAKWLLRTVFGSSDATSFNSYRLMLGDIARSVAAYAGNGVFLDVALSWLCDRVGTAPVTLRSESRPSGYSYRTLLSHFWRMVITSGTRGLRLVTAVGSTFAVIGIVYAVFLISIRLFSHDVPAGWTSLMVVQLITTGAVLIALGVIAEYVGVIVNMALGRPTFLIVRDLQEGPLGHRDDVVDR